VYLRFVQLPSRLIEAAVDQMATLPGVGRRTALRLVLHMLARDEERVRDFAEAMVAMREGVKPCAVCHNPTEGETCNLCANPHRDRSTVCVVEDVRDLLALESIGEYRGLYHVLGGVISPMDGVGPADLNVESLVKRAGSEDIKEVILALPGSMEGDTTAFYVAKKLADCNVLLTALARGVAVGEALQYADEATLSSSLLNRLPYQG
jgi:recombination protein RecR